LTGEKSSAPNVEILSVTGTPGKERKEGIGVR